MAALPDLRVVASCRGDAVNVDVEAATAPAAAAAATTEAALRLVIRAARITAEMSASGSVRKRSPAGSVRAAGPDVASVLGIGEPAFTESIQTRRSGSSPRYT